MDAEIVRIGNSRGVRIPKALLEQSGLEGKVTLTLEEDGILIKPKKKKRKPREGWDEAFKQCEAHDLTDEDREWLDAPLDTPLE